MLNSSTLEAGVEIENGACGFRRMPPRFSSSAQLRGG